MLFFSSLTRPASYTNVAVIISEEFIKKSTISVANLVIFHPLQGNFFLISPKTKNIFLHNLLRFFSPPNHF